MPFSHLAIEGQGDVKACCLAPPFKDNEGGSFNLNKRNLSEIRSCTDFIEFQKSFKNGERHPYCQTCWNADDSGLTSLRKTFSEIVEDYDYQEGQDELIFLEIKLGLKCNLRCGICNPVNSSKWAELHSAIGDSRKEESDELLQLSNWVEQDRFYSFDNFSGVRLFHIMGGEPFLVKENERLIDLIIAEGDPSKVTLWYNTNGTVFPKKLIEKFQLFKKVKITLSIDDIGQRFEFQRFPAKWNIVERNFEKFSEIVNEKIQVKLDVCWNLLNSYYIEEIVAKLAPIDRDLFKLDWPNLAHRVHHYAGDALALHALSEKQRELYSERLELAKSNLPEDYSPLVEELQKAIYSKPVSEEIIETRRNRISFLEHHQKMPLKDYFASLSTILM